MSRRTEKTPKNQAPPGEEATTDAVPQAADDGSGQTSERVAEEGQSAGGGSDAVSQADGSSQTPGRTAEVSQSASGRADDVAASATREAQASTDSPNSEDSSDSSWFTWYMAGLGLFLLILGFYMITDRSLLTALRGLWPGGETAVVAADGARQRQGSEARRLRSELREQKREWRAQLREQDREWRTQAMKRERLVRLLFDAHGLVSVANRQIASYQTGSALSSLQQATMILERARDVANEQSGTQSSEQSTIIGDMLLRIGRDMDSLRQLPNDRVLDQELRGHVRSLVWQPQEDKHTPSPRARPATAPALATAEASAWYGQAWQLAGNLFTDAWQGAARWSADRWQDFKQSLLDAVEVCSTDSPDCVFSSSGVWRSVEFTLSEIRLALTSARLAALQRDTAEFRQAIREAQDLLQGYRGPRLPQIGEVREALAEYEDMDLRLPELVVTEQALRRAIVRQFSAMSSHTYTPTQRAPNP